MSMQTNCIYGYGFYIAVSDEQIKGFMLKHKETIKQLTDGQTVIDYIDKCSEETFNPKEDLFDWCDPNVSGCGVYSLIAAVMTNETGIRFDYISGDGDYGDDAIVLEQLYPWIFNEKEKALTQDEFEEICEKYINDLNADFVVEDVRMEFFG